VSTLAAPALACAVLLLLTAGCGEGDAPPGARGAVATAPAAATASSTPAATATPPAVAADGCAPGAPGGPGQGGWRVPIDGGDSEVLVDVPSLYRAGVALPLVLNLHGGQTTRDAPREHARYTGLAALGEAQGFIVVTPPTVGVASVLATLERVTGQWCVDRSRVYAAGLSRGAGLAVSLACSTPRPVAAIATVAGLRYVALPCDDVAAVPVIAFHGTADRIAPFEAALEAAQRWARHNGCASGARPELVRGPVTATRYAGCRDGAAVEFYAIEGDGHTWAGAAQPGGAADETTQAVRANELAWAFFTRFRLER
jgi:polyhydroxybutyrate depolymerase